MQLLKKKALGMVEDLQQLIESGKLNDVASQKLNGVLTKLRGVLQEGVISREALAMVLSEAIAAIGTANGAGGNLTPQQRMAQLWQKIDTYNKEIDDDFENMRKAGIVFDEKLWNKHKQCSEYLQTHLHDIEMQKALNAVDDQLLEQAERQLRKCPNAKPHLDDAKNKSKERHKDVAEAVAMTRVIEQDIAGLTDADLDIRQGQEVTMNDVSAPAITKHKSTQDKTL